MKITNIITNSRLLSVLIFLSLALLLSTPGGSVGVFVVLVLISLGYMVVVKDKPLLSNVDKLFVFTLCFMLLSVLPAFATDGFRGRYIDLSLRYLLAIPVLLLLIYTPPKALWLFAGAIVGSFSALVLAIYQYYFVGLPRVDGFLYSINFGYLACALAFLSLPAAIYCQRWTIKVVAVLAFLSALYAMILTGTRGAYIAVPVLATLFLMIYSKQLGYKILVLLLTLLIAVSIISYITVPQVKQRFNELTYEITSYESGNIKTASTSNGFRIELWKAALAAFQESPIYGLNYREREALNEQLVADGKIVPRLLTINRGHAHSEYFEILATRGLLGFTALMMLYLVPGSIFLRRALNTQGKEKALATAGVTFIAGFMVYGISEAPLQGNVISGCYALTVVAIYAMLKRPEESLV